MKIILKTYELGQPKNGSSIRRSYLVNHWELGLVIWRNRPWHITACAKKKKVYTKLWHVYNSTRSRRDIAEDRKTHFFNTNFVIKSSFPIEAKVGGDIAEHPRRRPIFVSLPNSPPIKRYCQSTISIHKASNTKNAGFSAMPRSILRVLIWIFNLVFELHVQTNWKPAFFTFLFFRQVMAALVFFRNLYRSHLSNKK